MTCGITIPHNRHDSCDGAPAHESPRYIWSCHPYWADCHMGNTHRGLCEWMDRNGHTHHAGGDALSADHAQASKAKADGCLVYLLL